jgi:hypothetical protein
MAKVSSAEELPPLEDIRERFSTSTTNRLCDTTQCMTVLIPIKIADITYGN